MHPKQIPADIFMRRKPAQSVARFDREIGQSAERQLSHTVRSKRSNTLLSGLNSRKTLTAAHTVCGSIARKPP